MTIIIALDQSSTCTGYCVLDDSTGSLSRGFEGRLLNAGVLKPGNAASPISRRMEELEYDLTRICEKFRPSVMLVEYAGMGTYKSAKAAEGMAVATHFCQLVAEKMGIKFLKHSPSQVKKTVTGNGNAKKEEVQAAVADIFAMEKAAVAANHNMADAMAGALNWIQNKHWIMAKNKK